METENKKNTKQSLTGFTFRSLFSGTLFTNSIFSKNFAYILFLVICTMCYMYNKFLTEKVINNINKTKQEVNELKAISASNTAELMHLSKESVVTKMVEEEGLEIKPLKKPPEKIVINKDKE